MACYIIVWYVAATRPTRIVYWTEIHHGSGGRVRQSCQLTSRTHHAGIGKIGFLSRWRWSQMLLLKGALLLSAVVDWCDVTYLLQQCGGWLKGPHFFAINVVIITIRTSTAHNLAHVNHINFVNNIIELSFEILCKFCYGQDLRNHACICNEMQSNPLAYNFIKKKRFSPSEHNNDNIYILITYRSFRSRFPLCRR